MPDRYSLISHLRVVKANGWVERFQIETRFGTVREVSSGFVWFDTDYCETCGIVWQQPGWQCSACMLSNPGGRARLHLHGPAGKLELDSLVARLDLFMNPLESHLAAEDLIEDIAQVQRLTILPKPQTGPRRRRRAYIKQLHSLIEEASQAILPIGDLTSELQAARRA